MRHDTLKCVAKRNTLTYIVTLFISDVLCSNKMTKNNIQYL